jgi:hypothetical protein
MDPLHRAAMRVAQRYTASQLDKQGHALYDACPSVKPTWQQLGDVTKSVWRDKAALKLSGHPCWWSINPDGATTITQAASSLGIQAAIQECLNMSINSKKVAEQLDIISEAFMALAGTFRSGSSSDEDGAGDGEVAKPVRSSKSAASKPAAKKAQAEQDELSIDDVRTKLKELVEAKGKEKMVEALESVGAGKLADVDESQYQELVDKAQEFIDKEDEAPAKKPAAKKTAKKAGPTLDDVNEAAKALIAADKPAYLKLSKKLGKPSEMEEDDYATAIAAYEQAMPEGSEDGEDDLL